MTENLLMSLAASHTDPRPSPLAEALARVAALGVDGTVARIGPVAGEWFRGDELIDPASARLARGIARQAAPYDAVPLRTAGSFFVNAYAWSVLGPAIAAYLVADRVADLALAVTALRYRAIPWEEDGDSGVEERVEVRFLSRRCAVLDGDPAAGHPSSVVLPTRTVLRRWLRSGIEAHMAAIIERVHQVTGLAVKAQWALVADACAQWFVTVGTALGDAERGEQEGLAFVKTPGSPLWNPRTGYVTIAHAGLKETFRIRGGCCRWHTLPAGDRCSSCVLRSCEDRDQRFREYLASRIAEAPATT